MKVRALNHLRQTVGSLSIERVLHTEFDLDDKEVEKAVKAGLVKALEDLPVPAKARVAKERETR